MTIQQLQYVLAVYRAGSISAAAVSLNLAQPNLSGTIRALEEELGYPIFLRNNKGVQPTQRGIEALELAAQMVDCHKKMTHLASKAPQERLRVGGPSYSPVGDAFSQLCRECQDQPAPGLSHSCEHAPEAIDKLVFTTLDIAILLQSPDLAEKTARECRLKGLRLTPIADVPIVLRIGPNHPLYHAPEIQLSDFHNYTFVDYNNRAFLDSPVVSSLLQINPDRVVTVSDRAMKNRLILETSMFAIGCKMPPSTNERFRFRCIPLGNLRHRLFALERINSPRTAPAQRYLDILSETFRNL